MNKLKYKSPKIHRTPVYRVKAAYANMIRRCENKSGKDPTYRKVKLKITYEEWKKWALPQYTEMIENNKIPSVSRIGDIGHYEIKNIEIIPMEEHRKRQKTILLIRPNGTKLCCRCREVKHYSNFNSKKSRPDNLDQHCRHCKKLFYKEYKQKMNKCL